MANKVYDIITEKILAKLEQGVVPWKKQYSGGTGFPKNLVSKKPYSGMNVFLLWNTEYNSEYWLTYNQAQSLGGSVKRGEKSRYSVVFWKLMRNVDADGKEEQFPFFRYSPVFNYEQCENLPVPKVKPLIEHDPITEAERIIANMPSSPEVRFGQDHACYFPAYDRVDLPSIGQYTKADYYYETFFHELAHSTGHKKRLDRKQAFGHGFGSISYGKEELIAEMAAAFLCAESGIEEKVIDHAAAYLDGWIKAIRSDNRILIQSASAAQKAANYILGLKD